MIIMIINERNDDCNNNNNNNKIVRKKNGLGKRKKTNMYIHIAICLQTYPEI